MDEEIIDLYNNNYIYFQDDIDKIKYKYEYKLKLFSKKYDKLLHNNLLLKKDIIKKEGIINEYDTNLNNITTEYFTYMNRTNNTQEYNELLNMKVIDYYEIIKSLETENIGLILKNNNLVSNCVVHCENYNKLSDENINLVNKNKELFNNYKNVSVYFLCLIFLNIFFLYFKLKNTDLIEYTLQYFFIKYSYLYQKK